MEKIISGGERPRYELLDGLRGVAALLVILYHFGEAFATSPVDQWMNHGYLAVDFFFVLSGFVVSYAYDRRWNNGLTKRRFAVKRLIRLHPMVILGVALGLVAYIIQGSVRWDGTPMPFSNTIVALALGLLLIPLLPGVDADVRGNGEMFPLNGPSWSLFFEYIGSAAYCLFLHRFSARALRIWVVVSGILLAAWACADMSGAYHLGVGWTLADLGFFGGLLRVSFSFSVGMLMSRGFRPRKIRGAFWICSLILIAVMAVPYVTTTGQTSILNGIYDSVCTLLVFPAVVYIGACGTTTDLLTTRTCGFLGRISYPVYIIHYPAMYLFYAWVWNNAVSVPQALPVCGTILAGVVLLAWAALRFYDEPVRAWLTRRFDK